MAKHALSIKQKIIVSCAIVSIIMASMIVATVYLLGFLRAKIVLLEAATKLEEQVLELRRCEKNSFLYHDQSHGRKALFLIEEVQRILEKNRNRFDETTSSSAMEDFTKTLDEYETRFSGYLQYTASSQGRADRESPSASKEEIRVLGTRLSRVTEMLARNERYDIEKTMALVSTIQFGQLLLFGIVMAGFWVLIFRKIVYPLRVLEEHTMEIGGGTFQPIEHSFKESEIRRIFDSFNHMSEELRERQRQLVRSASYASLGTLVAGAAHEVNTPLSTIRLHAEVLQEEIDELEGLTAEESPSKEFFSKKLAGIIREADRTLKVVHDLLQLTPQSDLAMKSTKLSTPVQRAIDLLGTRTPEEVNVVATIGDDVEIFGDEQRITTVFLNLISNGTAAIEGRGTITIQTDSVDEDSVVVSVHDTGQGIPEEYLDKIFDPFFSTKPGDKGTGLGLSIVHEIVVAHNGRIWAESLPGSGTTFRVRLPARGGSQ